MTVNVFEQLSRRWQEIGSWYCSFVYIDPTHVAGAGDREIERHPLIAKKEYFRLWLVGGLVGHQDAHRKPGDGPWTVYSALELAFGNRRWTFPHVTRLESQGERALTPLLPYNGGPVEIELGLFAGRNGASEIFQLEKMAGLSAYLLNPEASALLGESRELQARLGDFAADNIQEFRLRSHTTLVSSKGAEDAALVPGYYAVVESWPDKIARQSLWVRTGRLCVGPSAEQSRELIGLDYLLLRIEARAERDDWDALTRISHPYRRSIDWLGRASYETDASVRKQLLSESRAHLRRARRAALRSGDLTDVTGRNRVVEALHLGYQRALEQVGVGAVTHEADAGSLSVAVEQLRSTQRTGSRGGAFGQVGTFEQWASQQIEEEFEEASHEKFAAAARPATVIVRSTPHMDVVGPQPFRAGDAFVVRVFADRKPAREGETVRDITAEVDASTERFGLDVWLAATDHFVLDEHQEKELTVEAESGTSNEVSFEVSVRPDLETTEGARLWAYFSYQGRPCGQVSVGVGLTREARDARPRDDGTGRVEAPAQPSPGAPGPPDVLAIESEAVAPDLTIEITDPRGDLRVLWCRICSPHSELAGTTTRCRWILPQKTDELVAALLGRMVLPGALPLQTELRLRGTGKQLWDAAPQVAKEAIWRLIDAGKLKTILVVSADPYFPWEMMVPYRDNSAGEPDREPLGVEYAVGRWVPLDHRAPPQRVCFASSLVVAPDYPGPSPKPLAHAAAEAQDVCQRVPPARWVKPARFLEVTDALVYASVDLVHFVCHGKAAVSSGVQALYLEDAEFDSIQLAGLRRGAVRQPFVFLNACEVGRPVASLNGIGGFAREFIKRGATGVVAPLWSVEDGLAHEVAEAFYERLSRAPSVSFAEVMREIRGRAYSGPARGKDSYAAYCFYGDPCAMAPPLHFATGAGTVTPSPATSGTATGGGQ